MIIRTPRLVKELSKQEIFDTVLNHLRKQKIASYKSEPINEAGCKYRMLYKQKNGTETILKCAVGVLISDDEYDPEWEDISWEDMFDSPDYTDLDADIASKNLILMSLQEAHDNLMPKDWGDGYEEDNIIMDLTSWEREMQSIAVMYDLVYTPPSE